MMKNRKRWPIYLTTLAIAVAITPAAIEYAAIERGYSGAIGSEYLFVPLLLLIAHIGLEISDGVKSELQELKQDEYVD